MVLPREHRLRGRFVFDRLYQRGRRLHGTWMVLRSLEAEPALLKPDPRDADSPASLGCRMAVVISSKVSKRAVQRNRLRRLLHRHLLAQGGLCHGHQRPAPWLLVSLKPGAADVPIAALLGECSELLRQAGLNP